MQHFTCRSQDAKGFTLVELLLAMSVSALIAVVSYAGLSIAIDADESLRSEVELLSDIQRSLNIIEEDLSQIRPRSITNASGYIESAFKGGSFIVPLLSFTRGGLGNPASLARSELQRVQYRINDGVLWRQHHLVLDGIDVNVSPQSVVLLNDVLSLEIEFLPALATVEQGASVLNSDQYWFNYWDSDQLVSGQQRPLPIALKLSIEIKGFGQVIRVLEVP